MSTILKVEEFVKLFPRAKTPQEFVDAINEYCPRFGIDTRDRLVMFLAQGAHETGEFTRFEENMNYSDVGMANTWPNRYADKNSEGFYIKVSGKYVPNELAKRLHRKPEAIANNCYANRMGNGPESSGDGWAFRGKGVFQLTGRYMYEKFTKDNPDINIIKNPELLLLPAEGVISAAWFWERGNTSGKSVNSAADKRDVRAATKIINGGAIGLAHRQKLFTLIDKTI